MKRFSSKKKKTAAPSSQAYVMPSDAELLQKLRDIEEVNNRIAGNAQLQEVMRKMLGQEPAEPPKPRMDEVLANARSGGLSYIMGGPADLPERAPKAHKLWAEGAVGGALRGDDAYSLDRFNEALAVIRGAGHKTAEARVLYNIGLAHFKLGNRRTAITTLLEGKSLAQASARELGREARKLQRFEEEVKTDNPRIDVAGVPHIAQAILEKYLEALAIVYDADSQQSKADECRDELKRLHLESV
jgi:tetratricopeptide (TPR) repeat protein